MGDVPGRLLRRLDDLAVVLAARGDAIALIALGSVGRELERLDDHSDLDFFVVVEDEAKGRYLEEIDWLEAVSPVGYSFVNTVDGRKILFVDGLYAEYAVFTLDELRAASFSPGRLVWSRADAPAGLEETGRTPDPLAHETAAFQIGEALTNLYVGLQREARGEHLAATRLIQTEAVNRLLTLLDLTGQAAHPRQDAFAAERGAEARFPPEVLPLAALVPGYGRNREAALATLEWLETRTEVDPLLAEAIRELARSPMTGQSAKLRTEPRMAFTIRPVQYFYVNVRDELGAAYQALSQLAQRGVDLLAFSAVPAGPMLAQFALFPAHPEKLVAEARSAGMALDGPHHALLVQGDDELGALADVHERLLRAGVDVYASAGVTDARDSFGYLVYVREDQFQRAVDALGL